MGIIDIILLLCFIPAIVTGISKGFVKQAVEFVAIVLGIWAALHFSSTISAWLAQYIHADKVILNIISFLVVVVAITLLLNLVGSLLSKMMNVISLGWLNAVLGIVFGILKTALVLGLLIMLFEWLNSSINLVETKALGESQVYTAIRDFTNKMFPYIKSFVTEG